MVDTILFPSSYFNYKQVDEDFQKEYDSAIEYFDAILFDYDLWIQESKIKLTKEPAEQINVLYRGWMMPPAKYETLYEALLYHNIKLFTSPKEYALMHVFPNIYQKFGPDTAKMKIYQLHEQIPVKELQECFHRFMVKDYVKSVKNTNFPKFFDAGSLTQEEFDSQMENFYTLRGNLLTGGICIKEYLDLQKYDNKTNEWRVFYVNHQPLTISPNSAQPVYAPVVPQKLVKKYQNLDSNYYTVDFAELSDGTWRIIEAGDGGVSGLSEYQNSDIYYHSLCFLLN